MNESLDFCKRNSIGLGCRCNAGIRHIWCINMSDSRNLMTRSSVIPTRKPFPTFTIPVAKFLIVVALDIPIRQWRSSRNRIRCTRIAWCSDHDHLWGVQLYSRESGLFWNEFIKGTFQRWQRWAVKKKSPSILKLIPNCCKKLSQAQTITKSDVIRGIILIPPL